MLDPSRANDDNRILNSSRKIINIPKRNGNSITSSTSAESAAAASTLAARLRASHTSRANDDNHISRDNDDTINNRLSNDDNSLARMANDNKIAVESNSVRLSRGNKTKSTKNIVENVNTSRTSDDTLPSSMDKGTAFPVLENLSNNSHRKKTPTDKSRDNVARDRERIRNDLEDQQIERRREARQSLGQSGSSTAPKDGFTRWHCVDIYLDNWNKSLPEILEPWSKDIWEDKYQPLSN
jgi:hypothetical protein